MDLGTGAINNEYWGTKMIEIITQEQIQNVLLNEHRQYLVGDLKLPQRLQHIYDDKVEMGITRFEKYACEKPHFHPRISYTNAPSPFRWPPCIYLASEHTVWPRCHIAKPPHFRD